MTSNLIEVIENIETLNIFQKNTIKRVLKKQQEVENLERQLEDRTKTKECYNVEYHNENYVIVSTTPAPTFGDKSYPYTAFIKKDETWYPIRCNYETFEEAFLAAMACKLEGSNYNANRYAGQLLGIN